MYWDYQRLLAFLMQLLKFLNHNNRFGYAVSPLRKEKAINFAGAKTYPAKPYPGTDGKPLNDSTREFGHNTRFGAGFNK